MVSFRTVNIQTFLYRVYCVRRKLSIYKNHEIQCLIYIGNGTHCLPSILESLLKFQLSHQELLTWNSAPLLEYVNNLQMLGEVGIKWNTLLFAIRLWFLKYFALVSFVYASSTRIINNNNNCPHNLEQIC